ncbi:acyltransferase [Tenacibaculum sp. E3R01]|uniref:lysophospholipid acyltransferase family protein n=1 Tax=Tenacibaculum sp. E3R01 TaxID=2267227 RepID=UPI000DE81527|nr:lysophospholipid acyltransferase family protein [Tenacibaculum sp. E3R01]RBW61294.1 acyltransferase [Tenacibaculum sp. E3R01]
MRTILYYTFKFFIKTGLFFYSKKIKINGSQNIPKDGAVLFTANHPNGLIDPILIATHIKRKTHFLVRAAVFKKPIVAYFFDLLGMMPVYRIRDGIKQLSKNEAIFNKCEQLLSKNKTLLIFPEGSHNRKRSIRPLSKGFTRIIFQTLDKHPKTKLYVVPVGITYQNSSKYPSKIALSFGIPIETNSYMNEVNRFEVTKNLKKEVLEQLKQLTVHIPDDANYEKTLTKLNKANVDFTEIHKINNLDYTNNINDNSKSTFNYLKPLLFLVILNSIIPYTLWKIASKKVNEIEFLDTFRFGFNIILFPFFYIFQSLIINYIFNKEIAIIYLIISFFIILAYAKLSPTNAE